MIIHRIRSQDEYINHQVQNKLSIQEHEAYLKQHTPEGESEFTVSGYSYR